MAAGGAGMKTKTYTINYDLPPILRQVAVRSVASIPRQFFDEIYGQDLTYVEKFYAIYFNTRLKPLHLKCHGQGTMNATLTDIAGIVREALLIPACSVMVFHNHPSDDTNPSRGDREVTKQISAALQLIGVRLIDHLIITQSKIYSFKEEGLL